MGTKRIIGLNATTDFESDDYIAVDGSTAGTRKMAQSVLKEKMRDSTLSDIHNLTPATDFANGDTIVVDNANGGPKGMDKDVLLAKTAQNALGSIHNLPTTITAFRTGDVVPVDGPDGTAKFPADMVAIHGDYGQSFYESVGYLNKTDGQIATSQTNYHCYVTPYIETAEGDEFYLMAKSTESTASVAFYDSAKLFVSALQVNSLLGFTKVSVPSGVSFVRFSSYEGVANKITFELYGGKEFVKFVGDATYSQRSITGEHHESLGFLENTGTIATSQTAYHCIYTDPVEVSEGKEFLYRGHAQYSACSAVFFDSSWAVVSNVKISSRNLYSVIKIPSGVKYVKFGSFEIVATPVTFEIISVKSPAGSLREDFDRCGMYKYTNNSGYLISDGTFSPDASYKNKTTNFIKASAGDKFYYRGDGRYSAQSVLFFDASMGIIGYNQYMSKTKFTEITCPADTAFVRFSSMARAVDECILEVAKEGTQEENIVKQFNDAFPLSGKKYIACGDSFTHGDFSGLTTEDQKLHVGPYAPELSVYPFFIGNRTMLDVSNIAVNGSTIAQWSGSDASNCFTYPSTGALYTKIPADAAIITLRFGINDSASAKNIPLGTIDDADNTTFYGAWNVVMSWLVANRPNARIGIIITDGLSSTAVGGKAVWAQAQVEIAKKYGVPYLDIDKGEGCPVMGWNSDRCEAADAVVSARLSNNRVSVSNYHPNKVAQEHESFFIQDWIESL